MREECTSIVRVTKEFTFEMAHALYGYDGSCRHIHGHSYGLSVTVCGRVLQDTGAAKNGMVIDFGQLKTLVKRIIVDPFDHALVLNASTPDLAVLKGSEMFQKTILVDYQPTSENLVADFAQRINKELPDKLKLQSVRLRETATSYAEWFAADNC